MGRTKKARKVEEVEVNTSSTDVAVEMGTSTDIQVEVPESVTEKQSVELTQGAEVPSQLETMFIEAISAEVKVAKKENIVLNGKNYVQVTTPEGVTYLV